MQSHISPVASIHSVILIYHQWQDETCTKAHNMCALGYRLNLKAVQIRATARSQVCNKK